jgi:hypothetical protein
MRRFWPTDQPSLSRPCSKAWTRALASASFAKPISTPTVRTRSSCAFAGIAWSANAPPSNVMNSRRLMGLTRGQRSRVSIAGQARAPQQKAAPYVRVGSDSVIRRCRLNVRFAHPKADFPILKLLPRSELRDRRHRSLARRRVAMRWRAVMMSTSGPPVQPRQVNPISNPPLAPLGPDSAPRW